MNVLRRIALAYVKKLSKKDPAMQALEAEAVARFGARIDREIRVRSLAEALLIENSAVAFNRGAVTPDQEGQIYRQAARQARKLAEAMCDEIAEAYPDAEAQLKSDLNHAVVSQAPVAAIEAPAPASHVGA